MIRLGDASQPNTLVMALRAAVGFSLLILLAGPWIFDPNNLKLMTEVFCVLVLATMWNLLAGYADIVSVGQHAFVGIGAYAFFGCTMLGHFSPVIAITVSALVAFAIAVPTLVVIFRLRSAYLAVGTWVVAEVLLLIAGKLPGFGQGAGASLSVPVIRWFGGTALHRYTTFYVLSLSLAMIAIGTTWAMLRSSTGLGLKAMRDNEEAAAAVGVNLRRLRTLCFLYTAPFLGMAGALIAIQKGRVSPLGSFSIADFTVDIVFIVVIGGIGSLEGPIIGTILFFVLRELLADFGASYLMVLGLISIFTVLVEPKGIWGFIKARYLKTDVFVVTHAPIERRPPLESPTLP